MALVKIRPKDDLEKEHMISGYMWDSEKLVKTMEYDGVGDGAGYLYVPTRV